MRINAAAHASPTANLQLTITPMQCSIEKTHDGTRELLRITPAACQRYVNVWQRQNGQPAPYSQ